jgi:hypothetical protein
MVAFTMIPVTRLHAQLIVIWLIRRGGIEIPVINDKSHG